jgi:single-strand DNA-binding protein
MLNKIILIGRLGKDPELKVSNSGQNYCDFSIATTKTWKDKQNQKQEKTSWHYCRAWGNLSQMIHQYFTKGTLAFLEGEYETGRVASDDGSERFYARVRVDIARILNKPAGQDQNYQNNSPRTGNDTRRMDPSHQQNYNQQNFNDYQADDIPF